HFLEWLHTRHWPGAAPGMFAPRRLYGEYLEHLLQQEFRAAPSPKLRNICEEVIGIETLNTGVLLTLKSGARIQAGKVALALGNPASSPDPGLAMTGLEDRWQISPWLGDALRPRHSAERILLVGTGLTAVDSVLALLSQESGCRIYM